MPASVYTRFRAMPTALAGLALGLAGLGAGLENALPLHGLAKNLGTAAASVLLLLLILKYLLNPGLWREDLRNPALGCLPAAGTMALMLIAHNVSAYHYRSGEALWLMSIAMHIYLLASFGHFQAKAFRLELLIPSWFLPFVGLIMPAATVPSSEYIQLARVAQLAGAAIYFGMLPIMCRRLIFMPPLPAQVRPTAAIMAAPPSLLLAGYLNLSPAPSPVIGGLLLCLVVPLTFSVYLMLPRLLRLPFSPAFSSFTFPLAISATALYKASERLPIPHAELLRPLAGAEMLVAALVIAYVCLRYIIHYTGIFNSASQQ